MQSAGAYSGFTMTPAQIAAFYGGPAATVNPSGGYVSATQQQNANPVVQQTVITPTTPPWQPLSYPPPFQTVVNPSPSSTLTATGSNALSPTSVTNQANGSMLTPTPTGTGDWFTDPTQEVISGLPNWALVVMGGAGLFMVVSLAGKR
jgi:hypothetical protein